MVLPKYRYLLLRREAVAIVPIVRIVRMGVLNAICLATKSRVTSVSLSCLGNCCCFFVFQLARCRFGDENVWSGFKVCGERGV